MPAVQRAPPNPPGDPPIAQAQPAQLVARDDTVLPRRQLRDRLVERR
jgi:hypothetical protein